MAATITLTRAGLARMRYSPIPPIADRSRPVRCRRWNRDPSRTPGSPDGADDVPPPSAEGWRTDTPLRRSRSPKSTSGCFARVLVLEQFRCDALGDLLERFALAEERHYRTSRSPSSACAFAASSLVAW